MQPGGALDFVIDNWKLTIQSNAPYEVFPKKFTEYILRFLEKKYGETSHLEYSAELLATLGELSRHPSVLDIAWRRQSGGIIGRISQTLISAIYQAMVQSSFYAQTDTCPVSAFTVKFQSGAPIEWAVQKTLRCRICPSP